MPLESLVPAQHPVSVDTQVCSRDNANRCQDWGTVTAARSLHLACFARSCSIAGDFLVHTTAHLSCLPGAWWYVSSTRCLHKFTEVLGEQPLPHPSIHPSNHQRWGSNPRPWAGKCSTTEPPPQSTPFIETKTISLENYRHSEHSAYHGVQLGEWQKKA